MVVINPMIEISLVTVAVVVASRFLQSKMIDKKKQKAAQGRMKEKQAKIKELMKQDNEKNKGEMQKLQQEVFEEMGESMQGSMRYMLFSLPLFFGAFIGLGHFYGRMLFDAPFLVPKFDNFFFLNPFTWAPVDWVMQTGWLKWYFITYLITSIFLGIILKIKEKVMTENKAI